MDYAKSQSDESLPRPWSKHSQGSSANARQLKAKGKLVAGQKKAVGAQVSPQEVEQKKTKFREFLKLMGSSAGTSKEKQSWNDQFEAFMGSGSSNPVPKKAPVKKEEGEPHEAEQAEEAKGESGPTVDDKRLFVMNLSYQVTKEEVQELFEKYGEVMDVEIPFRKYGKGVPLGIGFVRFTTAESAISAFASLDKTYF